MSFTLNPPIAPQKKAPKKEFLPTTDLHNRGISLSAMYAGFKGGPKNFFNVQPVVL